MPDRTLPPDASKRESLAPHHPAIGGGEEYDGDAFAARSDRTDSGRVTRGDADVVVASAGEFLDAVETARAGATIWLAADATLDLRDASTVTVDAPGVTVASDRGRDGSAGALVRVEKPCSPLLSLRAERCRVTGLRLRGEEPEYFDPGDRVDGVDGAPIYAVGLSAGVAVRAPGCEVDNVDVAGMTYAGVTVDRSDGGTPADGERTHVHHCSIHDNPAGSLGYGVVVDAGDPVVEWNWFDDNRHSVAGTGRANCSYEVRNCVFGPRAPLHVIDVHGQPVEGRAAPRAGRRVVVEHNAVQAHTSYLGDGDEPISAVRVRGRPSEPSVVANNVFRNGNEPDGDAGDAVYQDLPDSTGFRNLRVADNRFGRLDAPSAGPPSERRERDRERAWPTRTLRTAAEVLRRLRD